MKGIHMRASIAALVLACTMFTASAALAQQPPTGSEPSASDGQKDAAEERAAEFRGVRGPEAESVPGGALMLAAYAIVWVLLFLFLVRMRRLQRDTAQELERLSAEIRASESG